MSNILYDFDNILLFVFTLIERKLARSLRSIEQHANNIPCTQSSHASFFIIPKIVANTLFDHICDILLNPGSCNNCFTVDPHHKP